MITEFYELHKSITTMTATEIINDKFCINGTPYWQRKYDIDVYRMPSFKTLPKAMKAAGT